MSYHLTFVYVIVCTICTGWLSCYICMQCDVWCNLCLLVVMLHIFVILWLVQCPLVILHINMICCSWYNIRMLCYISLLCCSWYNVRWLDPHSSTMRVVAVSLLIIVWQLSELNTFFLKQIFEVPPSHQINVWRLVLISLISAPSIR